MINTPLFIKKELPLLILSLIFFLVQILSLIYIHL